MGLVHGARSGRDASGQCGRDGSRAAESTSRGYPHRKAGVGVMKIVPVGDKVAVKRLEAEPTTAGGIVLPDTAKEKPLQGKVLSVGDGRRLPSGQRATRQVAEGDRVVFTNWAGTELIVDGEEVLLMNEDEILAVLE
jgi:chaperonin GroES